MHREEIANFEEQLRNLCEHWRTKLTHCELVGILDTVKMGYHLKTFQTYYGTEHTDAPVIADVDSRLKGSPLPAEVENG